MQPPTCPSPLVIGVNVKLHQLEVPPGPPQPRGFVHPRHDEIGPPLTGPAGVAVGESDRRTIEPTGDAAAEIVAFHVALEYRAEGLCPRVIGRAPHRRHPDPYYRVEELAQQLLWSSGFYLDRRNVHSH
jgi:hypothetical protein